MELLALELTDTGILAVSDSGVQAPPSPGYACLEGGSILVGHEARSRARIRPRFVLDGFWDQLDDSPLPRPFPRRLRQSDLVHAHLSRWWSDLGSRSGHVIFVVPQAWTESQLALLLGIARAAGIPVKGLVDSAVASLSDSRGQETALHLDLLLHKAILSEIRLESGAVRERVAVDEKSGLAALERRWAAAIADLFVRRTRFDPLHSAESEQELFDRIPAWLTQVQDEGLAELVLHAGGEHYTVELTEEDVARASETILSRLVRQVAAWARPGLVIHLSHLAARIPGLAERLEDMDGIKTVALAQGAAGKLALRRSQAILSSSQDLPYVLSLPLPGEKEESPRKGGQRVGAPSHVVLDGVAHRLAPGPWPGADAPPWPDGRGPIMDVQARDDGIRISALGTGSLKLNGAPLQGVSPVKAGDRLELEPGGDELLFVNLATDNGEA